MKRLIPVALVASLALALVPLPAKANSGYPTTIHGFFPTKACKDRPYAWGVTTHSKNDTEKYDLIVSFGDKAVEIRHRQPTRKLLHGSHTWTKTGEFQWEVIASNLPAERTWGAPKDREKITVVECYTSRPKPNLKWGGDDEESTPAYVEMQFERQPYPTQYILNMDDPHNHGIYVIDVPAYEVLPDGSTGDTTYVTHVHHKYGNWGTRVQNPATGQWEFHQEYFPVLIDPTGEADMAFIDRPITHTCPAPPPEGDGGVGGGVE